MGRFRSPSSQAQHEVRKRMTLGKPRVKNTRNIHSLGTARTYTDSLKLVAKFMNRKGRSLSALSFESAINYLEIRSQLVRQKQLNKDREAMQMLLGQKLPKIMSELAEAITSRAYTTQQIEMIGEAQSKKYLLSTRIAEDGGLRAHELLTLCRVEERAADTHRAWNSNRFAGRGAVKVYTVKGKGGLVREVALNQKLAVELEQIRLAAPIQVVDRGIYYQQHYDIGGGKKWSDSFSKAAQRALGWSEGGHGVRHTFAQRRMKILLSLGYSYDDALELVSQEMGHFRRGITEVYLR